MPNKLILFSYHNSMMILIIAILIIIILLYFLNLQDISNIKTDENILITLRNMLKNIDNLFEKENITYWIDGGTLLGAVRHQDIIPWDDDADISVLKEDENKLLNLKNVLNKMGYGLVEFWGGYKIYPLNGKTIKHENRNWEWATDSKDIQNNETFNYKYPFIDVFIVEKFKDKFHYSDQKVRRVWPNYYHETKNLFPLKKYKFNTFTLFGPQNPIPYLNRSYGNDWPYKAYRQYDHENQIMFEKIKFDI